MVGMEERQTFIPDLTIMGHRKFHGKILHLIIIGFNHDRLLLVEKVFYPLFLRSLQQLIRSKGAHPSPTRRPRRFDHDTLVTSDQVLDFFYRMTLKSLTDNSRSRQLRQQSGSSTTMCQQAYLFDMMQRRQQGLVYGDTRQSVPNSRIPSPRVDGRRQGNTIHPATISPYDMRQMLVCSFQPPCAVRKEIV